MDDSRLIGIYLAAGRSRRMGFNKLNLPFGNEYLGSIALGAALHSTLDETIAVTRKGDLLHWLAPFLNKKNLRIVVCEDAGDGQSNSLKKGVKAAAAMGASGVVVLLGDQPFVSTEMINRLVAEAIAWQEYASISYLHQGIPKPPVYLARNCFAAIDELTGDQGARNLLRGPNFKNSKQIEWVNEWSFFDIDTLDDYSFLLDHWHLLKGKEGWAWRL